jgi:hypothetical protein
MKEILNTAERLNHLTQIIPPLLTSIPENEFAYKPGPDKWSKKEIIGHLIDSATNNHHRFIRSRVEDIPNISYNQDKWNDLTHYNDVNSTVIIQLWEAYNKLIVHIISNISNEDLLRKCKAGDKEHTLLYLITDYVAHLEHHLKQVVEYD